MYQYTKQTMIGKIYDDLHVIFIKSSFICPIAHMLFLYNVRHDIQQSASLSAYISRVTVAPFPLLNLDNITSSSQHGYTKVKKFTFGINTFYFPVDGITRSTKQQPEW